VIPAYLRVVFPDPGFFIGDTFLAVALDGNFIHRGSFLGGFDRIEQVTCGPHTLTTRLELGPIARTREYRFSLDAAADYRAEPPRFQAHLEYSRFWGNFSRKLDVQRV
jgi:hypothetical protein